jgi:hypothetical protein
VRYLLVSRREAMAVLRFIGILMVLMILKILMKGLRVGIVVDGRGRLDGFGLKQLESFFGEAGRIVFPAGVRCGAVAVGGRRGGGEDAHTIEALRF